VTEANVATLRAGYEALNRGDLSEVMALIDDDIHLRPRAVQSRQRRERSRP
jgi:ketosteroid isomerase-like protein